MKVRSASLSPHDVESTDFSPEGTAGVDEQRLNETLDFVSPRTTQ